MIKDNNNKDRDILLKIEETDLDHEEILAIRIQPDS